MRGSLQSRLSTQMILHAISSFTVANVSNIKSSNKFYDHVGIKLHYIQQIKHYSGNTYQNSLVKGNCSIIFFKVSKNKLNILSISPKLLLDGGMRDTIKYARAVSEDPTGSRLNERENK